MRLIYTSLILILCFKPVLASESNFINQAALKNGCIPAGGVEKNKAFLKRLVTWSVTLKNKKSSATMFWCLPSVAPGNHGRHFIIVVASESNHPWSSCPETIENIHGTPTNLTLTGKDVSGEFDSGGYYFACTNSNWVVKSSH